MTNLTMLLNGCFRFDFGGVTNEQNLYEIRKSRWGFRSVPGGQRWSTLLVHLIRIVVIMHSIAIYTELIDCIVCRHLIPLIDLRHQIEFILCVSGNVMVSSLYSQVILSVQLLKFQRLHSPLTEVKDWLIKNPESFQYWNLKWGTDTELITLKDCSVHNHENAVCTSS